MRKTIKYIVLFCNAIVFFALLLSNLSVYISPLDAGFLALFGLGFSTLCLLNIFFVLFWAWLKKWLFLFSLLALILSWTRISTLIQFNFSNKKFELADSLDILSYNVRLFDLYNWSKQKGTSDKIIYLIKEKNPQLICLQEYYSNDRSGPMQSRFINELKMSYNHISFAQKGNKTLRSGIATFSTFPIVNKGEIQFQNTQNKCIYSDIEINKKIVRIYNTHLESIHFGYKDYNYLDSINYKIDEREFKGMVNITQKLIQAFKKRSLQIEAIFNHINSCQYPVILCGDFNDTPVSYTYNRIRKILTDSFMDSGIGYNVTYHNKFLPLRIDYIFYGKQLHGMNYTTTHTDYSDHYPVECRVFIP